ncbi:hypothetical protein VP01_90g8 [Puccinia sorghi]|uniref:Uncharacterized protein n=1 Tax=Puccinia sorghi TaxID=27349 RepID=A0A0L6U7L1_9BASI|nr:hypothetical protein VP01_90g8 [Puccinia sorghi]
MSTSTGGPMYLTLPRCCPLVFDKHNDSLRPSELCLLLLGDEPNRWNPEPRDHHEVLGSNFCSGCSDLSVALTSQWPLDYGQFRGGNQRIQRYLVRGIGRSAAKWHCVSNRLFSSIIDLWQHVLIEHLYIFSSSRFPFQADSGVIRQSDIDKGIASVCGRTLMGPIDMKASFQKAENEGLPDLSPGGRITITAHQINADGKLFFCKKKGGGPYFCGVDPTATGERFIPIPIEVNIPGANGRSDARAIDLPLVAKMPKDMLCTGGSDKQTCLIRFFRAADLLRDCPLPASQGAKAGPFGGCLAFTQKLGTVEDANPLPADADLYTEAIEALKLICFLSASSLNRTSLLTPYTSTVAKKVVPLNLTPNKRSLPRRQTQTPQLMVYPPVSRIANVTGSTPASTSFGTNLDGTGTTDNNGGNGHSNNVKPPSDTSTCRQGQSSNPNERSSYVPPKSPTTEGILYEIATGPLGQADTPKSAQKPKDLKPVIRRSQYVFRLSE